MKVVLTGAAGFLGGFIMRECLARGWPVTALVRQGPRVGALEALAGQGVVIVEIDSGYASVEAAIGAAKPDVIIHVASLSRGREEGGTIASFVESNLTFATHLASAAAAHGVKGFVNAGSSWQYGEDGSYRPFNLYAATKQAFSVLLEHYRLDGLKTTDLILYDNVGPHDYRGRLIDLLIDAGLEGRVLPMSPGDQKAFLVDVRDTAAAFALVAERLVTTGEGNGEAYAVRGPEAMALKQLVALVRDEGGVHVEVELGKYPYRAREIFEPCASVPLVPGWTPRIPLGQTVRDIVAVAREARKA